MIHFSRHLKRLPLVVALVAVGSLIAVGSASATHPNTGLEPTMDGFLVPAYAQCSSGSGVYPPNGQHGAPLAVLSCGPGGTANGPRLQTGGGAGAKPAVGPDVNKPIWPFHIRFQKPPTPACASGHVSSTGSDVCLDGSLDSLVTFTTTNPPYVASAPFTGTVGLIARIQFTDHYNCQPAPCTAPTTGGTPGTGQQLDFGPATCSAAVGGDGKSHCNVSTTADTLAPGSVQNGIKTSIQIFRIRAEILTAPYGGTPQRQLAQQGIAWP